MATKKRGTKAEKAAKPPTKRGKAGQPAEPAAKSSTPRKLTEAQKAVLAAQGLADAEVERDIAYLRWLAKRMEDLLNCEHDAETASWLAQLAPWGEERRGDDSAGRAANVGHSIDVAELLAEFRKVVAAARRQLENTGRQEVAWRRIADHLEGARLTLEQAQKHDEDWRNDEGWREKNAPPTGLSRGRAAPRGVSPYPTKVRHVAAALAQTVEASLQPVPPALRKAAVSPWERTFAPRGALVGDALKAATAAWETAITEWQGRMGKRGRPKTGTSSYNAGAVIKKLLVARAPGTEKQPPTKHEISRAIQESEAPR